ncbi:MAG: two-component system response regulator [Chloroflexi bacterium RBG_16_56_8]|nr:MAG: two-component system response regulator [Chloroflexi bacterium RBG_16_56_8]
MTDLNAIDILLVEDNARDAELTIRALKKKNLANHLFRVEDGADALNFMFGRGKYAERRANHRPRVILLDLKLPKVDGLEVLRELRADARTKTIPIVIVTSSGQDPDIKTAYELGANSYVVKPVNFEAFFEAMTTLGFYWLLINAPPK